MTNILNRFLVPALGAVAAVVLAALMLLTCVDVAGRYFFGKPIAGAFELTEILLALLIFAGVPLVSLRGEHVSMDLFDAVTPRWLLRLQHAAACALSAVCAGFLAWRLWLRAASMALAGEVSATLEIKLAYVTYAMSVLMAASALAFVAIASLPPRHFHQSAA